MDDLDFYDGPPVRRAGPFSSRSGTAARGTLRSFAAGEKRITGEHTRNTLSAFLPVDRLITCQLSDKEIGCGMRKEGPMTPIILACGRRTQVRITSSQLEP